MLSEVEALEYFVYATMWSRLHSRCQLLWEALREMWKVFGHVVKWCSRRYIIGLFSRAPRLLSYAGANYNI